MLIKKNNYLCFLFKGSGEAGGLLVGGAGGDRFRLGRGSTLGLWFGNCRCRIHVNLLYCIVYSDVDPIHKI